MPTVVLHADSATRLDDAAQPILAKPLSLAVFADGRYIAPDRSDRDLKLYASDGSRIGTIGRAGAGPGEFAGITSGGVFRDSAYGFDVVSERLYLFGEDGRLARTVPVPRGSWSVEAVDDSLFLVTRSVSPMRRHNLLLIRADGGVKSSFFDPSAMVATSPDLAQFAAVVADARGGFVFATVFGTDSLYVFDYSGRGLGAAPVDREQPVADFRRLASGNGGRLRRPEGGWLVDGAEVVIALRALANGRAMLHVARYDDRTGVDRVEGGRFLLVRAQRRGPPAVEARASLAAGLMGRDRAGNPLLLGYAPGSTDAYTVLRLVAQRDTSG